MTTGRKNFGRTVSLVCISSLLMTLPGISASALENAGISYDFAVEKAGYAQGNITFTSDAKGTYALYWADGQGNILQGYYPIDTLKVNAGEKKSVKMGNHTAIPANAEKIVAVTDKNAPPVAVYDIPQGKKLSAVSGTKLYTFSAYSDIHIDKGSLWYVDAEKHFKEGLQYAVDKNSDYLVVSGDVVTNDSGPDKEWIAYEKILSQSDFVNPVWESDGNHDLRQGVDSGIKSFIKHSGTNSIKDSNKSYFYMIEPNTGDIFIFMSLELNKNPNDAAEFSSEQLAWADNLMDQYTKKGVNVFLVQHSPIKKFGAGDRMSNPYYKGLLNTTYDANAQFKEMIQKYPNVVWFSGHTHEDFTMDYNYSNENDTACHMVHIPSLAGSTMPNSADDGLERNGGKGFNSQGYYTEVYDNEIVCYGVNLSDKLIYPKYSYIMESTRTDKTPLPEQPAKPAPTGKETDISATLAQVSGILSKYYNYASYDQYQALKKLYYQYKNCTKADESVLAEFEQKINALSEHTGNISVYAVGDTYYFENNKSWSKVYGYAWDGSDKNAEWPGVKLTKAGESNGHDVYVIKFSSAGQYHKLIFTDGSSQTVDIELYNYNGNCFKLGSTTDGKYNVSNYSVSFSGETPQPPENPPVVVTGHNYALLHYISGEHDWTDTSTLFTPDNNGKYTYTFKSKGSQNMSFSIYDKTDKVYYSLSESASVIYSEGQTSDYTLIKQSSRGKSITIKELSENSVVTILYNPENNSVSVTCGEIPEQEPLENTSVLSAKTIGPGEEITAQCSAKGGKGGYQYQVLYKQKSKSKWTTAQDYSENSAVTFKPASVTSYDVCVKVKDNNGTEIKKSFTVTVKSDALKNESSVSAEKINLGNTITVNAKASGSTGTYTYAVYYKKSSESKWTVKQDFKANDKVTVKPAKAVDYDVCVKVKDDKGTVVKKYFNVSVTELVNTSAVSANEIKLGSTVKVYCSAKGNTDSCQYAVYYKKTSDTNWTTKQNYSSNTTVTIKPAKATAYEICIKVKDNMGTIAKKYFTVTVK